MEFEIKANCEYADYYAIADKAISLGCEVVKFVDGFDSLYMDLLYKDVLLALHYNVYDGVSLWPVKKDAASDLENLTAEALAEKLKDKSKQTFLEILQVQSTDHNRDLLKIWRRDKASILCDLDLEDKACVKASIALLKTLSREKLQDEIVDLNRRLQGLMKGKADFGKSDLSCQLTLHMANAYYEASLYKEWYFVLHDTARESHCDKINALKKKAELYLSGKLRGLLFRFFVIVLTVYTILNFAYGLPSLLLDVLCVMAIVLCTNNPITRYYSELFNKYPRLVRLFPNGKRVKIGE